jgi:nucleoside-diphosphate-sugar epimerase
MESHGKYGRANLKVIVTGHDGYIGSVMVPVLQAGGYEVIGLDTFFFSDPGREPMHNSILEIRQDIRHLEPEVFEYVDAIIHLAALSNDPIGEINPDLTHDINHKATINLAKLAKEAGVQRFLYASTCSVYGVTNQEELASEDSPLRPVSAYARSKVQSEADLASMADDSFSPVYLRNATAYGWSPRYRSDLVLNNLTCWAYTTGEIRILSDGTPWRPIVHVQDIANAFATVLSGPREAIHNQAFNVGINEENYQVRELAAIVQECFPDCKATYGEHSSPDPRSYRVDFSKINQSLPEFKPEWNARRGVEELRIAYKEIGLTREDFTGPKYVRLARLKSLLQEGQLDDNLYWKDQVIYPKM